MDDAMIAATAQRPGEVDGPDDDGSWVPAWLRIGRANPWISEAYDPPFTELSFREVASVDELATILPGNWSLGSAFYLGDLCFIQQVNGGDEWLVIRRGIPFESITSKRIDLHDFVARVQKASDDELRSLDY